MAGASGFLSIKSKDGNKVPIAEKIFFKNTTVVMTDLNSFAAAVLAAYDAVIEGQLVEAYLHIDVPLPGGIKAAPVESSNNMVGALEQFDTVLTNEPYTYWFPSWLTAGYDAPAHANQVDLTQGQVIAWNTIMLGTTDNTTITDEDGNNLTGALPTKAVKSARKQRRALSKSR